MVEVTLNYRTVYFFLMSFFAGVFFLSLVNPVNMSHPLFMTLTSFINIFLGITAWIIDDKIEREYERSRTVHGYPKSKAEERDREKINNLIGLTVGTFIFSLIGLIPQFTQYINN
jgi:hypothetical protein